MYKAEVLVILMMLLEGCAHFTRPSTLVRHQTNLWLHALINARHACLVACNLAQSLVAVLRRGCAAVLGRCGGCSGGCWYGWYYMGEWVAYCAVSAASSVTQSTCCLAHVSDLAGHAMTYVCT